MQETKRKVKILFLCTGNSCRSQMAEGWAKKLKSDVIDAYSAGVEPRPVDRRAIKVMAQAGVDISKHRSKTVAELSGIQFDYVITLCGDAKERCPFFPGETKVLHRGFEDPPQLAEFAADEVEALNHYRRVRDEIKKYVETLPNSLESQKVPDFSR